MLLQKGLKGKCSCSKNNKKDHWLDHAVDKYGVSILASILAYRPILGLYTVYCNVNCFSHPRMMVRCGSAG